MQYVGFWMRLVAGFLDTIIVSFLVGIVIIFWDISPEGIGFMQFPFGTLYYVGLWTWKGQTLGKMMIGAKIVKTDGSPIGIGRAILRYVGYFISYITLGIGYVMIAWDSKKQGLHDKIAGTCVIKYKYEL